MPTQKTPALKLAPALYELRHLRRALSRLEGIHTANSPTIENLRRSVKLRIRELDAQLGQTTLTHDQQ
jgi:hypothetical protein